MRKSWMVGIGFVAALAGCGKPRPLSPLDDAAGKGKGNYFPLETGQTWAWKGQASVSLPTWGTQTVSFTQAWTVTNHEQVAVVLTLSGKQGTTPTSGSADVAVLNVSTQVTAWGTFPVPTSIPSISHRLFKYFLSDTVVYVLHLFYDPSSGAYLLYDAMDKIPQNAGDAWQWTPTGSSTVFSAGMSAAVTQVEPSGSFQAYPVDSHLASPTARRVYYAKDVGPVRMESLDFDYTGSTTDRSWIQLPPNWGAPTAITNSVLDLTSHQP